MKRLLPIVMTAMLIISCTKGNGDESSITSLSIVPDNIVLTSGGTARLELNVVPEQSDDVMETIKWSTDNEAVATVSDDGNVQAVSGGTAVITAGIGGMSASCQVKVLQGDKLPDMAYVGDFYLSDGSILSQMASAEEIRAADIIGIVFSTDITRMSDAEKKALEAKGVTPHGLVMATKFNNEDIRSWFYIPESSSFTRDEREIGIPNIIVRNDAKATFELADSDINGYLYYQSIKDIRTSDYSKGYYPVFKAIEEYEVDVPAPNSSTGWYLPSNGQWFDILRGLCGMTLNTESGWTAEGNEDFYWIDKGRIISRLSSMMENINPDNKGTFTTSEMMFWTSSPASASEARFMYIDDNGFVCCYYYYKIDTNPAIFILGF